MTKVLLITNKGDVTTDFVVRELQRRNIVFYRFNTEELCKNVEVVLDFAKEHYVLYDKYEAQEYNLLSFTNIYYRRPELPKYDRRELTKGEVAFLQTEVYYTLEGIYRILEKKQWFNSVFAIRNAENKIYQLLLAKQVGFKIPESLITNKYSVANPFLRSGKNIIKPIHNVRIMDAAKPLVVFTTTVDRSFKKNKIEYSVNYFQREIIKKYDVRATFVGKECFAVAIDSQTNPETVTDWRKGQHVLKHTSIVLPQSLYEKCQELMKMLNLQFAAIDFVLDVENRYWFLEINPNGQWAWIEHLVELPISKEIVNQLCRL